MCYLRTQCCEIRCYGYILLFSNTLTQNLVAKMMTTFTSFTDLTFEQRSVRTVRLSPTRRHREQLKC